MFEHTKKTVRLYEPHPVPLDGAIYSILTKLVCWPVATLAFSGSKCKSFGMAKNEARRAYLSQLLYSVVIRHSKHEKCCSHSWLSPPHTAPLAKETKRSACTAGWLAGLPSCALASSRFFFIFAFYSLLFFLFFLFFLAQWVQWTIFFNLQLMKKLHFDRKSQLLQILRLSALWCKNALVSKVIFMKNGYT